MYKPWDLIKEFDRDVFDLIELELERQENGIELIASENFASPQVISCMANVFNNKYAEGLPGKRYYGGCGPTDQLENLAIERVCSLFGARFANVQAHSGAQANAAVLLALAKPGDPILGMDLSNGGHLTHGSKVNFSGKLYDSHFYAVDETGRINMDHVREVALKVKPKVIIAGASAYPRSICFESFRKIADEVNAYLMVDMAHIAGLVAVGLHPNPIPHAHVTTSTTHKTLRGPRGGIILWQEEQLSPLLNKGVFPGTQGGPLEHIIAAKAVCFKEALAPDFKTYQEQVLNNTQTLAEALMSHGFSLVSGGSDNHLLLIDLSDHKVSGKQFEEALGEVNITVNKNTVPKEKRSPFVTSGIRIGTPAVTSRGFKQEDMKEIAALINSVFQNIENTDVLQQIKTKVIKLSSSLAHYPGWQK